MKAHIGVDVESGVADVTQVEKLLHGDDNVIGADTGFTGVEKRPEHEGRKVIWQIAARRSTYKKLGRHLRRNPGEQTRVSNGCMAEPCLD